MASKHKTDEKVQVTVRCRPMNQSERQKRVRKVVECNSKSKEVVVSSSVSSVGFSTMHQTKSYNFDRVFGPNATQLDVYKTVIESQLQDVLAGYNCTVLAYGQTGTGKTYTMEGERSVDENYSWDTDPRAGIIPRALSQLFDCLEKAGCDFSVRVSLLEIYNEDIYDLLSSSNDMLKMKIYEDNCRKGSVVVSGLTEVHVRHKSDVYNILQQGAAKRRTAATNLNEFSSRSHSVFSVTVHTKDITHNHMEEEELVKIGKLHLVDLAGSENIGRSGAVDKRAREAGNINQSLLTLGRCITALVDRAPHIPYRESKLTRLLQDSLGGSTKTSIIATVSPGSDNFDETLSTLDYAARAKNIHNKPKINQKLTKRALIKEYDDEIERLRREVVSMREKNGVYVDPERYDKMVAQIEELTSLAKHREEEIIKMEDLLSITNSELSSCNEKLNILEGDLQQVSKELAEQHCLKLAHAEHGQETVKFAANLLETTNVVANDIEQVHNKVDRVKEVHKKNVDASLTFADKSNQEVAKMCSEMTPVAEQTKINIQNVKKDVGMLNDRRNQTMAKMNSEMQKLNGLMKSTQTTTLEIVSSVITALVTDSCDRQELIQGLLQTANELKREKFKKDQQAVDKIREAITKEFNDAMNFIEETRIKDEEELADAASFKNSMKTRVDRMVESRKNANQDLKSRMKIQEEKLQQMISEHQEMLRLIDENEMSDMSEMSEIEVSSNALYERKAEGTRSNSKARSDRVQQLRASRETNDEFLKKWYSDQQNYEEDAQPIDDKLLSATSQFSSAISSHASGISAEFNKQLQTICEETEKTASACLDLKNDDKQESETMVMNITETIMALDEDLDALTAIAEDTKDLMLTNAEVFVQQKVQPIVPTGVTPARKVYEYSRNIPPIPMEEDVLLNFRERLEEDSQEEDENPLNQTIDESETSNSGKSDETASESSEPNLNQSITIPDVGGVPFFKKNTHKRGKAHSSLKQPSRVPLRPVHNLKN